MGVTSTRRRTLYARLVDRYLDITRWSTSKKTALAAAIACPLHALFWLLNAWLAPYVAAFVDAPALGPVLGTWALAMAGVSGLAIVPARRGLEARWTVYLLIFSWAAFFIYFFHHIGSMTTPFVAIWATVLFLVSVFFDERAGWVAILTATVLLAGNAALELSGWLPYAPLLRARDVDAQVHTTWFVYESLPIGLVFLYCFSLVQLSVSARKAQQARLSSALWNSRTLLLATHAAVVQ